MKILATYCSAKKDERQGLLPAHLRYKSSRIEHVMAKAEKQEVPFMILSGQFGLIGFDHKLPYYNHLLKDSEVESHSNIVAGQIVKNGITKIDFYTCKIEDDPNIQPYINSIKYACKRNNVKVNVQHITSNIDN